MNFRSKLNQLNQIENRMNSIEQELALGIREHFDDELKDFFDGMEIDVEYHPGDGFELVTDFDWDKLFGTYARGWVCRSFDLEPLISKIESGNHITKYDLEDAYLGAK